MATTAFPNGPPPIDPPQVPQPPMHGSGPPSVPPPVVRGRWYRRRWVIGLGALFLGLVVGAAVSSGKTAQPAATVTAPARTVVQTVPGTKTKTVVRVRRVAGPTTTVTQTVSASTSAPAVPTPSSGSGAQSSSGNLTTSEQNAVAAAKNYLSLQGFSEQGLIGQLSSSAGDGYSVHDATVAVDSLHVDWNAEAVKSAKNYMSESSFSCDGLIQQLSSSAGEQYTVAQATYAATKVGLC